MPEARPAGGGGRPAASPRQRAGVYALAVVFVAAGAGLRLALEPVLGADAPLTLFVLAVVAAAWAGGLGPGLVATAASAAAAHSIWLRHAEPPIAAGSHGMRLVVLVVVGATVALVSEMRHRALLRAERAAEDADRGAAALRRSEARKTTQLAVTQVLAEATSVDEAVQRILATAARGLEWHCGELWLVDVEANALRCAAFWHDDGPSVAEFEAASRRTKFSPGVGLPGRVWTSGEGAWITDLGKDLNFPRQSAAGAAGLVSGFAFPVTFARETLGVACFYSRTPRAPDPELLASLLGVGSQFGQFLRRKEVEEERARLLESEQAARREAELSARAKDEFLAVLSHELRTPLNAIVGWSHLLRTGQLDEEQARRAVEVIDRNAKAQAQIVADVLDVSRIVMGKVRLDVRPVDLSPVVEMALDSLRPAAEAKGIRLEAAIAPESPRVTGDVDRLQQVVWNLLSNAVKFTPAGGRVLVQLGRTDGQAEIRVEDTGMGIDAELLPHVFERFRQGDSSSTRAHGGLGLGLSLVRHLVEMHGGTVTASSPGRDRGAVFVVSLPIGSGGHAARAERPRAAVAEAAPELAEAPADGRPSPSTTVENWPPEN